MVVADGIVGERLVLAIGGEGFAHWELERFADRRSGLFGNIMPIECVTEGGRCHARLMRERLGRITAILDELFEVDLAVVVDLSPHAALELVAVEQSDLLRGDAIQSQVPQRGFNTLFLILMRLRLIVTNIVAVDRIVFARAFFRQRILFGVLMQDRVEENLLQILIFGIHSLRTPYQRVADIVRVTLEQLMLNIKT